MGILIAVLSFLCAQAASLATTPTTPAAPPKAAALIDQLVSQNPKPITGDEDKKVGPGYKTPQGFDEAKQQTVYDARAALARLGPAAFPFLIERWDDGRYCRTTENGLSGYCRNVSIGQECRTILFDRLQPYGYWQYVTGDPRGHSARPQYPKTFLASAEDAKAWWEKHKNKSLLEMQLMVVEWIIAEEAKRPADFTDEERAYLKKFHDNLIATQKPVPWGNYYSNDREFRVRQSDGKTNRRRG